MIKVLLIGPTTKEKITDTRWVTAPLGVHYIASYLNKMGFYSEVYDVNIDEEKLEDRISRCNWDIVGFSSQESTFEYDLANICLVKRLSPNSILVAGGTGPSLNYQEYFNHAPIDIVIQAEGEIPMYQLCKLLDADGFESAPLHMIEGIIIRKHAKILTEKEYTDIRECLDVKSMKAKEYWKRTAFLYDSPDYDDINTFRLYTSNYCPMNCSFCTLTRLRKYSCGGYVPVVALSVDSIIGLIKKVLDEYSGCRQIFLVDDDFFILKKRGIEFCKKIIDLKEKEEIPSYLRFICLTNINRINEDNIDLIKQAGFKVLSIGIESCSQYVLDSLNKKQKVDKIWKTTELILSRDIRPYYTLILFAPDARVEDLVVDLSSFRKLGSMGVGLSIEPVFIPLKGTQFSEEHYPERVRKVYFEGTKEFIYKSFAWLPRNPEVYKIFELFEKMYPKYKKYCFDNLAPRHKEKNFQAYIILDVLEWVLMEFDVVEKNLGNKIYGALDDLRSMDNVNVDIVGSFIK